MGKKTMEFTDFIQRQIEQVGKVLGKLLAELLNLPLNNQVAISMTLVNEKLTTALNMDLEILTTLKGDELKEYMSGLHLSADHLDSISDFLEKTGNSKMNTEPAEALLFFQKAMQISSAADEVSNTTSFTRINRKERIKRRIQEIEKGE